jgi:hypothetical protein
MEAHETYLSEQCQKQGLVYVPGAGVFDENGAVFLVTECSSEGADLTHPKFVGKDQWHSLYVSDRQAVVGLHGYVALLPPRHTEPPPVFGGVCITLVRLEQ